jgi:Fe-S-cluster containining protein
VDNEQLEIEVLKAQNDFKGLGQKLNSLFKLPQSLCKTRGNCCRVATFKGGLSYEELVLLAKSNEEGASNAREFLTLFIPYETIDDVRKVTSVFVDRVLEKSDKAEPESTGFFHCRFLGEQGRCLIHEDRPTGCRVYPFPHENTIFHPGCGFEQKAVDSWRKIQDIQDFFEQRLRELDEEAQQIEQQKEMLSDELPPDHDPPID